MDAWWDIHYPWREDTIAFCDLSIYDRAYLSIRMSFFFCSTKAHLHRFTESSIHPPPIYIFLFIYKTIFLILHPSIHPYYIHFLIWWSIYPWLCEGGPTGVAPVLWREGARAHHLRHAEHRHGGENQSVLPFGSIRLSLHRRPNLFPSAFRCICISKTDHLFSYSARTYLPQILLLFVVRHGFWRFP